MLNTERKTAMKDRTEEFNRENEYVHDMNNILLHHNLRIRAIQDMVTKLNILADLPTEFFEQLQQAEEAYVAKHPEVEASASEWLRRFRLLINFKPAIQEGYWSKIKDSNEPLL